METTIQKQFHDIGGLLYRTSITAGYGKDILEDIKNLSEEDRIKLKTVLKKIEDNVVAINTAINSIKPIVYKSINVTEPFKLQGGGNLT